MSEHLSQCPLQLVECEYAHAGCCERIQRNDLAMHMEQNVQKHLLWAITASQKQITALEKKMERRMEVMNRQVKRQVDEVRKEKEKQLKEKDRQIDLLEQRVATLERHATLLVLSPVSFTVFNYSQNKGRWTGSTVGGPLLYTHCRGAKVQVCTSFKQEILSRVNVQLHQLPGEFDDEIKWPVKCTVTVHLLNQLRDQDHISGSQTFTLARPTKRSYAGYPDSLEVYQNTIENRSTRDIQYLKDDCLRFRVSVELN